MLAKVVVANVTVCILLPWNDGLPADVAHERTAPAGHLVAAFGFCETCAAFIIEYEYFFTPERPGGETRFFIYYGF